MNLAGMGVSVRSRPQCPAMSKDAADGVHSDGRRSSIDVSYVRASRVSILDDSDSLHRHRPQGQRSRLSSLASVGSGMAAGAAFAHTHPTLEGRTRTRSPSRGPRARCQRQRSGPSVVRSFYNSICNAYVPYTS